MNTIAEKSIAATGAASLETDGLVVRRVSDSMVAVGREGFGEIPYILPIPENSGRVDSAKAWRERAREMTAAGSRLRHLAVAKFIEHEWSLHLRAI